MTDPQKKAEQEGEKERHQSYEVLTFLLNGELYGVAIDQVLEAVKLKDLTRVPQVPAFIRGVINLRGEILAIVDIRHFLGVAERELKSSELYVLISSVADFRIGFLVEKIGSVLVVEERAVRAPLATLPQRLLRFTRGQFPLGEGVVSWLDLKSLFECEEMKRLKKGEIHEL